MNGPRQILRLIWPIVDDALPLAELIDQAHVEVAALAVQAHAVITGTPTYAVARSVDVPGSGCTTRLVLIAHAPARPCPPRPYRITA